MCSAYMPTTSPSATSSDITQQFPNDDDFYNELSIRKQCDCRKTGFTWGPEA